MEPTPPPDLVRGCDSPEGVRVLADWLDEHGGDGGEWREPARDIAGLTVVTGDGNEHASGDGNGNGDGDFADGSNEGDGQSDGTGNSSVFRQGFGHGDPGFGEPSGDGGRGLMRLET